MPQKPTIVAEDDWKSESEEEDDDDDDDDAEIWTPCVPPMSVHGIYETIVPPVNSQYPSNSHHCIYSC